MVGKCCIFICSSWSKLSFSSATPTCRFSFFRLAGKDLSFKVLKEGFASFGIFLMLIKFCWGLVVFKVPLCSHLFFLSSFQHIGRKRAVNVTSDFGYIDSRSEARRFHRKDVEISERASPGASI